MMALDSENEEERAATWNSFPKVNLRREGRKFSCWLAGWLTDARKLASWRNEGAGEERKADFD